jgi:uncharacterized SAM-dependent methyltransferase
VTAAFNMNLLTRINRELAGDFDLEKFRHHALYDEAEGRIEMQLISEAKQTVRVAGARFSFEDGEPITTEYSYKYEVSEFAELAQSAGFHRIRVWTDDERLFSVHYFSLDRRKKA